MVISLFLIYEKGMPNAATSTDDTKLIFRRRFELALHAVKPVFCGRFCPSDRTIIWSYEARGQGAVASPELIMHLYKI